MCTIEYFICIVALVICFPSNYKCDQPTKKLCSKVVTVATSANRPTLVSPLQLKTRAIGNELVLLLNVNLFINFIDFCETISLGDVKNEFTVA